MTTIYYDSMDTGARERLARIYMRVFPGPPPPRFTQELGRELYRLIEESLRINEHVEETITHLRDRLRFYGIRDQAGYMGAVVNPLLHYGVRPALAIVLANLGLRRLITWRHRAVARYVVDDETPLSYTGLHRLRGLGILAVYASSIREATWIKERITRPELYAAAMAAITRYRHKTRCCETEVIVIQPPYYRSLEDKLLELGIRLVDNIIDTGLHREIAEKAKEIAINQKAGYGDTLHYLTGLTTLALRNKLGLKQTPTIYTLPPTQLLKPSKKTIRLYTYLKPRPHATSDK